MFWCSCRTLTGRRAASGFGARSHIERLSQSSSAFVAPLVPVNGKCMQQNLGSPWDECALHERFSSHNASWCSFQRVEIEGLNNLSLLTLNRKRARMEYEWRNGVTDVKSKYIELIQLVRWLIGPWHKFGRGKNTRACLLLSFANEAQNRKKACADFLFVSANKV